MASFSAGTTFTDGVANDVTAAKLGALVNNATPTSGLIQDRTTETIVGSNDTLLLGDASDSNNLKKMTVANVFKSELTGTINSTSGTITTATIPTLVATTLVTTGTGTAASPAIVPTGDTNTGIFFPAADTIAFSEGGTEAMRIDSSGRVGIGTTQMASSDADLHIFRASGATVRLDRTGAGTCTIQSAETGVGLRDLTLNANTLLLNTASTERLRIDSSGNVGIGTTSPSSILHISKTGAAFPSSSNPRIRLDEVSSGRFGIIEFDSSTNLNIWGSDAGSGSIRFFNGTGSGTERLRIDSSGNVGIGVAPTEKLEVNGPVVARGGLGTFLTSAGALEQSGVETRIRCYGATANTGVFVVRTGGGGGSTDTERLRVDSSGNVGIGVTSPAVKLDVSNGNIQGKEILLQNGAASSPALGTTPSWYSPASGVAALSTNAFERLRIDSSGFVSIGTATGLSALHVHGNVTLSNTTTATSAGTGGLSKPATYAGYLTVSINGTSRKIPYYAT